MDSGKLELAGKRSRQAIEVSCRQEVDRWVVEEREVYKLVGYWVMGVCR
jgi:hypothetical protein